MQIKKCSTGQDIAFEEMLILGKSLKSLWKQRFKKLGNKII